MSIGSATSAYCTVTLIYLKFWVLSRDRDLPKIFRMSSVREVGARSELSTLVGLESGIVNSSPSWRMANFSDHIGCYRGQLNLQTVGNARTGKRSLRGFDSPVTFVSTPERSLQGFDNPVTFVSILDA